MTNHRTWALALFVVLFASPSLRADATADLGPVGLFSLTERSGRTVSNEDLRGKVWIAHFFFCRCSQGCAETTAAMARLQDSFAGDSRVLLVSFTLDPETDTALELRMYADDHGAHPKRWLFLTGPEQTIHSLVQESFQHAVGKTKDADPGKKIFHSFNLFVVDQDGQIRGYADGKDPQEVERLAARVRSLRRTQLIWPTVNASLNGCAGILLVAGYIAIRRRRETFHKTCMLSALVVSIVFLACYLYYHLIVLRGQSVRFLGEGWSRPAYFAVLISHTALAPVVAILALATAYLGLKDRRQTHRRLARWTWPLWLYVSITGVLVYVLLYHLF